jgi:hypothetical protein
MDSMTKTTFKATISAMAAQNNFFKTTMAMQPPPVVGGMPPMPIMLQPAFAPYLAALKMHADEFDKLLKLVGEVIDKS